MTSISRVVVPRDDIAARVKALADDIAAVFPKRDITILPVLTGALVFTADLIRRLPARVRVEPVSVQSYPGRTVRGQQCRFRLPPPEGLHDRHVLIVDDIFDSGQTMAFLRDAVAQRRPAEIHTCALLRKDRPDLPDRPADPDFFGFDIPDEFVVGYGLDFDSLYRNLPDICVLAEHARRPT